jgi:hypothetical protein
MTAREENERTGLLPLTALPPGSIGCKTIFTTRMSNIDSRKTSTSAQRDSKTPFLDSIIVRSQLAGVFQHNPRADFDLHLAMSPKCQEETSRRVERTLAYALNAIVAGPNLSAAFH